MKIALTADPELPVPPTLYGGIERVIDLLARGLVARGHQVTLFAHPDSDSAGRLVPWPGATSGSKWDTARNAATLARHVALGGYDVVHSFGRIATLTPILPLPVPKLMTYQRAITRDRVAQGHRLSRGTLRFSAISEWMMTDVADIGDWHMVPNGVPKGVYTFAPQVAADAPLVFLGRIEEIKGPHLAIEIAKATNHRLIIAGNIPLGGQGWFDAHVAPHLDGRQITYIGPVDDAQKNALLGQAKALVMAILWDEPFGIVMAEALACGTPVIGTRRGAVPEVVTEGETGFVRDTVEELIACIPQIPTLSRAACRARVGALYSEDAVVEAYLTVYRAIGAKG